MKPILLTLTLLAAVLAAHAQSWTNRYSGPRNGDDYPNAIALDSNGNVFVIGSSSSVSGPSTGDFEFATIKYSSAGVPLWTNRYKPVADGAATASAIAVDTNGNVFVTGESHVGTTTVTTPSDYTTIKYSSAGLPLWTNRYSGQGIQWDQQMDQAVALAVDATGNVIVTGSSKSGGGSDYATIKYSNTGAPLWTNLYSEFFGAANYPSGLVVDGSGTVFVTGASIGVAGFSYDYGTLAYSSAGVPLWTNLYNGPGDSYDWASGIALDGHGNVSVTGSSGDPSDYVTIKYPAQGSSPLLTIQRLGNNVVLSWTNAAYGLQSAPNVSGTFTNIPGATSPYTNAISGGQRFFRLAQ